MKKVDKLRKDFISKTKEYEIKRHGRVISTQQELPQTAERLYPTTENFKR